QRRCQTITYIFICKRMTKEAFIEKLNRSTESYVIYLIDLFNRMQDREELLKELAKGHDEFLTYKNEVVEETISRTEAEMQEYKKGEEINMTWNDFLGLLSDVKDTLVKPN